ncbi:ras GEF [Phellopilus nigrolimitatus]|nr:ras GEF [Phellopilus nigrolimitatus]
MTASALIGAEDTWTSMFTTAREHSTPDDRCDINIDTSPALSVSQVSEDSFCTAHSSVQVPGVSCTSLLDDLKHVPTQSHPTARVLRTSISEDSFIARHGSSQLDPSSNGLQRDASMKPDFGSTQPEPHNLSSPPSTMSLSNLLRSKVSRRRAAGNITDNETSTQDESDFDKSIVTAKIKGRVRSRLLSFKSSKASGSGSEQQRDFPLPPMQIPPRGASLSLSSLKTADLPSFKSPKSSSALKSSSQIISQELKRSRSHSVGAVGKSTYKLAKRLSVGNQSSRSTRREVLREMAIAVVGPTGCGKSTFIRKSLKRHDLSNSDSFVATITAGDMTRNITYTCRRAHIFNEFNTETLLSVYEYDSLDWKIDDCSALISVWPSGLPRADGIFVCYDESDRTSFRHVVQLLAGYQALDIPTLVIACKSDLEKRVPPGDAVRAVDQYSRMIEISQYTDEGKVRMRKAVDVLVRDIIASQSERLHKASIDRSSPKLKRTNSTKMPVLTLQTGLPLSTIDLTSPSTSSHPSSAQPAILRSPSYPVFPVSPGSIKTASPSQQSPTRVRSMNDILVEGQKKLLVSTVYDSDKEQLKLKSVISLNSIAAKSTEFLPSSSTATRPVSTSSSKATENAPNRSSNGGNDSNDKEKQKARNLLTPWATLDELLEKLFFLAISGDDPSFIAHFFLTYRRFATPRSILLGMQKCMNELRKPTGDITLACFAQMRICNLLEQWMKDYSLDFAAPGTLGALNAFTRQIISHAHTLSYGSDFLPFMEMLPSLCDEDAAWALKVEEFTAESDTEADSIFDVELDSAETGTESPVSSLSPHPRTSASEPASSPRTSARERRSSLPLSAMAFIKAPILSTTRNQRFDDVQSRPTAKDIVSGLQRVAGALAHYEAVAIANEITRRELELFLKIERRDWLRHTLIPGKKDPITNPIAKFNSHYNELHEWQVTSLLYEMRFLTNIHLIRAVSLILCHDKPRSRARQIEKFAEIAIRLRTLNNYSGLRAIITAINQATYPGDQSMEIFKTKVDLHKKFLSSDILLRTTGAHQSYRMALRNTKGPCIPSLEVHTSDLHRANEGNPDTKPDDHSKINWAKYNMIGRFVATTTALQERCRGPNGYRLEENKYIGQLFDVPVMDYDMQQSRVLQPADEDGTSLNPPTSSGSLAVNQRKQTYSSESSNGHNTTSHLPPLVFCLFEPHANDIALNDFMKLMTRIRSLDLFLFVTC